MANKLAAWQRMAEAIRAAEIEACQVEDLVMFGGPIEIEIAFRLVCKKHQELEASNRQQSMSEEEDES